MRWLINAEAAELLCVTPRTIKRWMQRPALRNAILAVRHGEQWRIPRPDNISLWEDESRARLKAAGVNCQSQLDRAFDRMESDARRFWPEVHRLYLAASLKALSRGQITPKAKRGIDLLCFAAFDVLKKNRQRYGIETMKGDFDRKLRRYWPTPEHFRAILNEQTRDAIEARRREADFTQAVRMAKAAGKKPTAESLAPLLHKSWLEHINDTKEDLPPGTRDFRQPQNGISIREFRRRYPRKKRELRSIIASIYRNRSEESVRVESADAGEERLEENSPFEPQ